MINYLKIIIIILIEFCFISIIKYYDFYKEKINTKIINCIIKVIKLIVIILLIILFIISINKYYTEVKLTKEMNLNLEEIEDKIKKEYSYYNIEKDNYSNNLKEPYIPEGFYYVEGNLNNGFVIEDINKNQYVWVPCSKEQNPLKKNNYSRNPFVAYNECYEEEYEKFISSALKNGGFYISRYEIGKKDNIPVSQSGMKIWNNICLKEAKQIVDSMYEQEEFNYEIINGFAYDTTLNWIFNNNSNINLEENNQKNFITGKKAYQNIYDILDDNFEITLEKSYSNMIIYRGFITYESEIKDNAGIEKKDNRWVIEENKKVEDLGIRTILYK